MQTAATMKKMRRRRPWEEGQKETMKQRENRMRGGTDDNSFVCNRRAGTVGGRDGKVKEMLCGGGRARSQSRRRKHVLALMTECVRTVLAVGRRHVKVRSTSQTTTSDTADLRKVAELRPSADINLP